MRTGPEGGVRADGAEEAASSTTHDKSVTPSGVAPREVLKKPPPPRTKKITKGDEAPTQKYPAISKSDGVDEAIAKLGPAQPVAGKATDRDRPLPRGVLPPQRANAARPPPSPAAKAAGAAPPPPRAPGAPRVPRGVLPTPSQPRQALRMPAKPAAPEPEVSEPEVSVDVVEEDDHDDMSSQEMQVRHSPSLPPPAEGDLEPIGRFGRFDLLGRLAVGGMAELLLARDTIEGSGSRHVVVKAVRGEFAQDGDFAEMFLNEGRLAMRLSHPNICTVYECGRNSGRFFMAMEYVHGQTLRDVLVRAAQTDRALPIPVLLRIFALTAEALDFAHRARDSRGRKLSIVHRDVSPHNIMIRYDGVVKLLDFGVAKAEHQHGTYSSDSGALKGKFSYMSPEQAMGNPIDARADIFALGVCIFEAVTGRRLFHRKAQYDTLKAILEQDAPPLCAFRDDVPDSLEEIVQRALHKDREKRYQRAGELQHDLDALLAELRVVANTARIAALMDELFRDEARRGPDLERDDEIRMRYATPASAPVPEPLIAPPGAAIMPRGMPQLADAAPSFEAVTPRSRVPLYAGLGAGLIALVALGGFWLSSGSEDPAPSAPQAAPTSPEPAPPAKLAPAVPAQTAESAPAGATLPAAPQSASGSAPSATPAVNERSAPSEAPSSPSSTRANARVWRPLPERRRHQRGTVIVTDPGF